MALIKHLTKHGNSYALIIDRALIELLGIDPSTPLEIITTDGQSLIITPKRGEVRKKAFKKNLGKVHEKYGKALKRLAEE